MSKNAVLIQFNAAIISYCLVAIIAKDLKNQWLNLRNPTNFICLITRQNNNRKTTYGIRLQYCKCI